MQFFWHIVLMYKSIISINRTQKNVHTVICDLYLKIYSPFKMPKETFQAADDLHLCNNPWWTTLFQELFSFIGRVFFSWPILRLLKTLKRLGVRKVARKISLRKISKYPLLRTRVPNIWEEKEPHKLYEMLVWNNMWHLSLWIDTTSPYQLTFIWLTHYQCTCSWPMSIIVLEILLVSSNFEVLENIKNNYLNIPKFVDVANKVHVYKHSIPTKWLWVIYVQCGTHTYNTTNLWYTKVRKTLAHVKP